MEEIIFLEKYNTSPSKQGFQICNEDQNLARNRWFPVSKDILMQTS